MSSRGFRRIRAASWLLALAACNQPERAGPPPPKEWGNSGSGTQAAALIVVVPASLDLAVGAERTFTAQVFNAYGRPVSPTLVWESQDSTVASVTSAGLARAVRPGVTTVTATAEGVVGRATLTVR